MNPSRLHEKPQVPPDTTQILTLSERVSLAEQGVYILTVSERIIAERRGDIAAALEQQRAARDRRTKPAVIQTATGEHETPII